LHSEGVDFPVEVLNQVEVEVDYQGAVEYFQEEAEVE
jgi:hypothetical protein